MDDYKQMYLTMMKATEGAIGLLVQAQQDAEELYLAQQDPEEEP